MDQSRLSLVRAPAGRSGQGHGAAWPGVLVAAVAAIAWFAGGGPSGRAAAPLASEEIRAATVGRLGPEDVTARLVELRRHVARSPLDARERSGFAALALVSFPGVEDAETVAAFHARTAMRTAPVTVPVIRRAAAVLIESGRRDEAMDAVRATFAFDPGGAARMLAAFTPFLSREESAAALPDDPAAWRALAEEWTARERPDRALNVLKDAVARWPDDPAVVRDAAARLVVANDLDTAGRILLAIDPGPDGDPRLLTLRARALAWSGRTAEARSALQRAIAIAPDDLQVRLHGGDAWLDLGDRATAREWWERGRYLVPSDRPAGRVPFVVRTARAAERAGETVEALRAWRAVLDLAPADPEARRRIEAITGLPATPPP